MDFTRRELTEVERWTSAYETLVEQLSDGYDMCVYEYTNDLSCRQSLEDVRSSPAVRKVWPRIDAADTRLRALLLPTKRCIHGDHPRDNFWFWGYPPNSPELEEDLRAAGTL